MYEQSYSNSGIDFICDQSDPRTGRDPVFKKAEDGADREGRRSPVASEAGTPTMGGVIILASVAVTSLIYVKDYPQIIPVLFLTVGFGLIGFLDDYLKVVMKRSDGLYPMQKMALQIVVTAIFAYYLVKVAKVPLTMIVPFTHGYELNLGWLAIPVLFFAVIGTVNGTNFTDGLDGLASSVTVLVAGTDHLCGCRSIDGIPAF